LWYVVWLSRLRFEQQAASRLTSWQKARALSQKQQEELVLGLQHAVLQWNAQTCLTEEQKDCQARRVMFSLQVGGSRLRLNKTFCCASFGCVPSLLVHCAMLQQLPLVMAPDMRCMRSACCHGQLFAVDIANLPMHYLMVAMTRVGCWCDVVLASALLMWASDADISHC
jgi:hypothetical protein